MYNGYVKLVTQQKMILLTKKSKANTPETTFILTDVRLLSKETPKVVTRVQHNVAPPKIETRRFASVILHQLYSAYANKADNATAIVVSIALHFISRVFLVIQLVELVALVVQQEKIATPNLVY